MLIKRLPQYNKQPDIKTAGGGSIAPPPVASESILKQVGSIDSKVEKLLTRIAMYSAPELAPFYDLDTGLKALKAPVIAPFHTDTTVTILTSPTSFPNTIVRGLGIFAFDPAAYTDCSVRFLVNNMPIPRYQTGIFTRGISAYNYTDPLTVYIVMPANSTMQLTVRNYNTTTDYWFKARVLGWYE